MNLQSLFSQALHQHHVGQLVEAEMLYRQVLAAQPDHPEALHHLGVLAHEVGRHEVAMPLIRRALLLKPDYAIACNNLANVLLALHRHEEALATYYHALRIQPGFVEAQFNLSNLLKDGCKFDEALAGYQSVLALRPGYADAWLNLGNVHKDRGELDEAVAAYRRVLQLQTAERKAHSNLIYTLHFCPGSDEQTVAEAQAEWNRRIIAPLRTPRGPETHDRNPERRLRIGYVSPDFRHHPVSHFLLPLLEAHDKTLVEIYCYASVPRPDDFTERAKRAADVWRDALGLEDERLDAQIRADRIDILVDLSQHMAGNRLPVFARKPAPVQVSWLGYPASTGLAAMDYRLTDHFLDPEGSAGSRSVDVPVRLPDCWFCFHPGTSPEPDGLPTARSGRITFGCLNNFSKITAPALRMWARVLRAVPDSRLLLHCPTGATQTRLRTWFESEGITRDRLELVPRTSTRMEYLLTHQRIDIVLDSFPYNGGTTTCEALWMGVPVVTLAGDTAVSRLGLTICENLGLSELVAFSEDDYVRIATEVASDQPRLAALRATLRARMQASPLMDAPRFGRHVETAYRTMWRKWCNHPA
jgi:predicted O-linked N-acetylglucosamine transferase (SPINDLY family)